MVRGNKTYGQDQTAIVTYTSWGEGLYYSSPPKKK